MIEDKKLPKPIFGEDIIPPDIQADFIINIKTGSIRKKKQEEDIPPMFPHTSIPTMGSAFTPTYIQGNVDCEFIKTKAKDLKAYGTPDLNTIIAVFHRDMFPKNVRFQCSDCPSMPPFLYIADMVTHGVKYHMRPLTGVLDFLINLMDDIARR